MTRAERDQRELIASMGVTIERERGGRGSHTMLYCRGPQGQRFALPIGVHTGDWRGLRNMEMRIRRHLALKPPESRT